MPTSKPTIRRGRLAASDKDYIKRYAGKRSVEEIAAQIRRAPTQVAEYMASSLDDAAEVVGLGAIELRPEWHRLKNQFDEDELAFFKYRYDQLMTQFGRDDVLPTEEMQIFGLIEVEVMASQAMAERKVLVVQQKIVRGEMERLYGVVQAKKSTASERKAANTELAGLEAKFGAISTGLKNIAARQDSYRTQINQLLGQLKGTRDQRVKVIEGNRASFLGHLKALQLEDFRRSTGDDMEMMRAAMDKERKRMAAPHTYVDGSKDQPLLTPETVMESYDDDAE